MCHAQDYLNYLSNSLPMWRKPGPVYPICGCPQEVIEERSLSLLLKVRAVPNPGQKQYPRLDCPATYPAGAIQSKSHFFTSPPWASGRASSLPSSRTHRGEAGPALQSPVSAGCPPPALSGGVLQSAASLPNRSPCNLWVSVVFWPSLQSGRVQWSDGLCPRSWQVDTTSR